MEKLSLEEKYEKIRHKLSIEERIIMYLSIWEILSTQRIVEGIFPEIWQKSVIYKKEEDKAFRKTYYHLRKLAKQGLIEYIPAKRHGYRMLAPARWILKKKEEDRLYIGVIKDGKK